MPLTVEPSLSSQVGVEKESTPSEVEDGSVFTSLDALGALFSFAAVIALFYKTVFFAAPIARVYQLANLDALFRDQFSGAMFAYDRTAYLLKPGMYHLVSSIWRSGNLPLWNSYNGCGIPLVGDLQSQIFSPWILLFTAFPIDYVYNVLPVLQLATCSVGVYFLSRELRIGRVCSVFAAITATLCPYFIYQVELTGGPANCLLPYIAWMMVRVERSPSVLRAIVAGAVCALTIMCGHSEAAFFAITTASFLMVSLFVASSKHGTTLFARFVQSLKYLSIAAVTTVCLAAPVFFPFLEYMLHCDCYKFHAYYASGGGFIQWQGLWMSLLHPAFGGKSPSFGFLCITLMVAACAALKRRPALVVPLALTCLFVFDSAARLLLIAAFDKVTGLFHLSRNEALPEVMLPVALLMAVGVEESVRLIKEEKTKALLSLGALSASVLFLPLIFRQHFGYFGKVELEIPDYPMKFSQADWTRDFILFLVLVASVVAIRRLPKLPAISALLLIIGVSLVSQIPVTKTSMPVQPRFTFTKQALLSDLKQRDERVSNLGSSLLPANVNLSYDIRSVAYHNPVTPERYNEFMRAAGARADGFNAYFEKGEIASVIDLASVRYFLSLLPITSRDEKVALSECLSAPLTFSQAETLKLRSAKLHYDVAGEQIVGNLSWTVKREDGERFIYNYVVSDESGKPYWFGGGGLVRAKVPGGDFPPGTDSISDVQVIVPTDVPTGKDLIVGIQIVDLQQRRLLHAAAAPTGATPMVGDVVALWKFKKQENTGATGTRFSLVSESKPHRIRLYENTTALPQALLVHDVVVAGSDEEALKAIKSPTFDPNRQAIIESPVSLSYSHQPPDAVEKAQIKRPSPNQVDIKVTALSPGLLVLSDQYFPGWVAELDGKPTKMLRANYLFRGVEVPAGDHTVVFKYVPFSFWGGIILAALFSLATLFYLLSVKR